MNLRLTITAALIVLAGYGAAGQQGAPVLMEAARKTEVIDGDLSAAIKQYEAIATAFAKSNRTAAADALLRVAECYQKMGDSQARKTYERLLREFPDQRDAAALARTRLGTVAEEASARKGDRAVWTGREVDLFGTVSPDGRYLSYVDWTRTNNLMLRDLVAGTSRALTANRTYGDSGYAEFSTISRDGQQIAFAWQPKQEGSVRPPYELRMGRLEGSGAIQSRVVRRMNADESIHPFDWSPDARGIAVLVERADRSSQIGVLSVADGSLRQLKSIDWHAVNKMVFSPDGRFIAYDLQSDTGGGIRIFVMPIDGSRDIAVVDDASRNHLMGWAADGQLVFVSDRSGKRSLWTVSIDNGHALESPRLARENIGSTWSLGLTPSGTLYIWQQASARYVKVAPFDLKAGRMAEGPAIFQQFIDSRGRPRWTADGRYLLFESCGSGDGERCSLFVRSTETGSVREVPHGLHYASMPVLAPDAHAIAADGSDTKGRRGLWVIDVATGRTTLVERKLRAGAVPTFPEWSPDSQSVRYAGPHDGTTVLLDHNLATSEIREIYRATDSDGAFRVSPDGRHVAFIREDRPARTMTFMVAPLSGGAPRALWQASGASALFPRWQWTRDSQAAIVLKRNGSENAELWFVPINGTPRKLDFDTRQLGEGVDVHPDGRLIAFAASAGAAGDEVWALENFLTKRP